VLAATNPAAPSRTKNDTANRPADASSLVGQASVLATATNQFEMAAWEMALDPVQPPSATNPFEMAA
jgi:hypothetical protein